MLQSAIARLSLFGGLDTKTDPKQVVQGKVLLAENVVFTNPGKFQKRPGYAALNNIIAGSSSGISSGALLTTYQNQAFIGTGSEAYSYSQVQQLLIDKGVCESIVLSSAPVVRNVYQQTTADLCVHPAGISASAWEDSRGGVWYSVYDTTTNQVVGARQISATSSKPKTLVLGSYIIILYIDTGGLYFISISASSPQTSNSAVLVGSNLGAGNVYDAAVDPTAGNMVVAYFNTAGTNKLTLVSVTSGLIVSPASTPSNLGSTAISTCLSAFFDASSNVWVALYDGSNIQVTAYNCNYSGGSGTTYTVQVALSPLAALGTVRNVTGIVSTQGTSGTVGEVAAILYEVSAGASYNNYVVSCTATGNASGTAPTIAGGAAALFRSVGLGSKPWVAPNGRVHFVSAYQSAFQPTYFVGTTGGSIVGKIAPGVGGGLTKKSILPEVTTTSAGVWNVAILEADSTLVSQGVVLTQTGVQQVKLDFTQPQQAVYKSTDLHVTGGLLMQYDGSVVVEHSFNLWPENVAASITSTTLGNLGISTGTAQYMYAIVWEWMDASGLVHQSAPSIPAQAMVTTGSGNTTSQVTLTIPTLRLSNRGNKTIGIAIYRTTANQSVFYRVNSYTSPLLNDMTVDTVQYVDSASDASIIGNLQLVFNPLNPVAEVGNYAVPAPLLITSYRDRLVVVPAESPFDWYFSKEVVEGTPVEFSQSLVQTVVETGGPIGAIYQLDANLIFFKQASIYYSTGFGPTANGQNNDYTPSTWITSSVGCTNQKSIAAVPDGLLFQSPAGGIYKLGRDLTVTYAGAPVEALTAGATVTSATVVAGTTQVRFTLSTGIAVVYDWLVDQWASFTNLAAADATMFQSLYTYLTTKGVLLQETPGSFTDNGNFIRMRMQTSWLSFVGLQGFQRVWRFLLLGDYRSPHLLRVSVAYDFNPNATQVSVVNAATLLTDPIYGDPGAFGNPPAQSPYGGNYPLYQFRVHLAQQKCQSVQVTIEDAQTAPYGEGCSWSALAFDVGVKKGIGKKSAANSVG